MIEAMLTGYVGITLALFLTGCGLPIPEELPIVAAGVLSRTGTLDWRIALPCTILAAIAGDSVIYFIGYRFGRSVLKDHPWWVGFLTPDREKKAEHMIRNHGLRLLFIVRFLPGLRMPVYLTTGILRMPFRRFLAIDALCATVVVATFFGLSYWLGPQIKDWIQSIERFLVYIVVGIVFVVGVSYYFKRRRRMAEIRADENAAAGEPGDANAGEQVGESNGEQSSSEFNSRTATEKIGETHSAG